MKRCILALLLLGTLRILVEEVVKGRWRGARLLSTFCNLQGREFLSAHLDSRYTHLPPAPT